MQLRSTAKLTIGWFDRLMIKIIPAAVLPLLLVISVVSLIGMGILAIGAVLSGDIREVVPLRTYETISSILILTALVLNYRHTLAILERKGLLPGNTSVAKAPGSKLLAFVDFFYSPKTVELTFKPLIADWRYEYFEALKQGRTWKARWISMRYRYSFIMAMSLSKVFSLLKQIRSVSK